MVNIVIMTSHILKWGNTIFHYVQSSFDELSHVCVCFKGRAKETERGMQRRSMSLHISSSMHMLLKSIHLLLQNTCNFPVITLWFASVKTAKNEVINVIVKKKKRVKLAYLEYDNEA